MTAIVKFTYPLAGRVIFRQEVDSPLSDTSVFVESLLYSDGTKDSTNNHQWQVHVDQPGKDYFNWTGRCLSAGRQYNPYKVSTKLRTTIRLLSLFLESSRVFSAVTVKLTV